MRHLQLRADAPTGYLAVLRPLPQGAQEVQATPIQMSGGVGGVCVRGDGIDDELFLGRSRAKVQTSRCLFDGSYGAVLRRPQCMTLVLAAPGVLQCEQATLELESGALTVLINSNGGFKADGIGRGILTLGRTKHPLDLPPI